MQRSESNPTERASSAVRPEVAQLLAAVRDAERRWQTLRARERLTDDQLIHDHWIGAYIQNAIDELRMLLGALGQSTNNPEHP